MNVLFSVELFFILIFLSRYSEFILDCPLWILKWQICELPNEKEAVYGALDKWSAWETEFPLIAVAKALKILRKRGQWVRVIQVRLPLFSRTCVY